jgi:hypothetical protein
MHMITNLEHQNVKAVDPEANLAIEKDTPNMQEHNGKMKPNVKMYTYYIVDQYSLIWHMMTKIAYNDHSILTSYR